ncbi:hypothetical protein LJC24_05450, partial [Desulfococcaceae bacterium OttesenSCG-928-F15]|nr:hypothetical protein [Desulfococcaceae bacterium OttesenSCG-928-F15]
MQKEKAQNFFSKTLSASPGKAQSRKRSGFFMAAVSLFFAVMLLSGAQSASATNYYWIEETGNWETVGNWNINSQVGTPATILPTVSDDVSIDNDGTVTIGTGVGGFAHFLYIGNSSTGTLELTAGGKVTSAKSITIGSANGSSGTITVDGNGSELKGGDYLYVGNEGTGVLKLTNGGTASSASTIFIGNNAAGDGTVTVSGIGSELKSTGSSSTFQIGYYGKGTLELADGGKVSSLNSFFIGNFSGSSGTVKVGAGSILENTAGGIHVGYAGTGVLNLTGGGNAISAGSIEIGSGNGSSGTVTVSGIGSLLENKTGRLDVGKAGMGELHLTGGGKAISKSYISIGDGANSNGIVTVDGDGSELNSSELHISARGTGRLELTAGGKASSSGDISIGSYSGSSGTVTVDGAGSELKSSRQLSVGNGGTGKLELTDGGKANSTSNIFIGSANGSYGILTVDGADTELKSTSGALYIGANGTGRLELADGGKASSASNILIGHANGSYGTVTISGPDSILESTGGYLYVGNEGTGKLDLTAGGKAIAASNIAIGYYSDRYGTVMGTGTVTVSGTGSELKSTGGTLQVGDLGIGVLNLTAGGKASSLSHISIGNNTRSHGTVTVDGSELKSTGGELHIGASSTGRLYLSNGGKAIAASFINIGNRSGSRGTVTVDGAGSLLESTGSVLYVGANDIGKLDITRGGRAASASHIYIGTNAAGDGTVTVDGNGSILENTSGGLYVGNSGTGQLDLSSEGKAISAGNIFIGNGSGSRGTVVVGAGS